MATKGSPKAKASSAVRVEPDLRSAAATDAHDAPALAPNGTEALPPQPGSARTADNKPTSDESTNEKPIDKTTDDKPTNDKTANDKTISDRSANEDAEAGTYTSDKDASGKDASDRDGFNKENDRTQAGSPSASPVTLKIIVVRGGMTNIQVPVAVGARYEGLAFAGPTRAYDRMLDSWLTRAVDLGIIGSSLGQLFLINLQQFQRSGRIKADNLLLAGMGEPGRFATDSLQFIVSNLVVAVKVMGYDEFASPLLGIRRAELTISDAVRGLVRGVQDGYDRLRGIADDDMQNRGALRNAAARPLALVLVHPEADKAQDIVDQLHALAEENAFPRVKLVIARGPDVAQDTEPEQVPNDIEPDRPVNYLRITRSKAGAAIRRLAMPQAGRKPLKRSPVDPFATEILQFSALSETSVVPQRDQELNARILRDLADHMTQTCALKAREDYGAFFTNILIPDAFRKLTEGPPSVTLEVDETTALYPWEMAANKRYAKCTFLSRNLAVSRQFRSVMSPPPTSPPPLNNRLNALIIADPGCDELALPAARDEGAAVVEVLEQARKAWGGRYDISVKVRIGPCGDEAGAAMLKRLQADNRCVVSAEPCQPLELAMLVVNEQFDLIHYAGHGMSDPKTQQTGWVFSGDCVLSAKDIFRVRQVPRLVFANACFSALTSDSQEQRGHMTGLAQAFFARGIPNFIGAGWEVDDACARECARWFYARLLGLSRPGNDGGLIGQAPPATIGESLRAAREMAFAHKPESASWGAYQHYGRVNDKLIALSNAPAPDGSPVPDTTRDPTAVTKRIDPSSVPAALGAAKMSILDQDTGRKAAVSDMVFVNGIDVDTGTYAVAPRPIDEVARQVLAHPGVDQFGRMRDGHPRSFALPFDMDPGKLEESGWGIVFHEKTPQPLRDALQPLMALRQTQARDLFKVLDYKAGEQARDWYARHGIAPANIEPALVPYYLLLVGPPDLIPFEFQYLLGVDYAIGRLAFDTPAEYERYARSVVAYEGAKTIANGKEIAYWGTRHLGDPATEMSSSSLIAPLANGIAGTTASLKQPLHQKIGYGSKLRLGDDATKANLLEALHGPKPPAMLFTASHGMALRSGHANQTSTQGALLCQDWPGFGSVKPEHFLAASDIGDDANVNGVVALLFACFGAGTPDADQFLMDLSEAGKAPPLAPQPFVAALPRRLLAHPNGSALAVIGHVDRAWGYSIQSSKVAEPQIGTFRNSIGSILTGDRVGHAACGQFGSRYSNLSVLLLNATSPTAANASRLPDRDLVAAWLERNDAQNYVILGDPAVRIRTDLLS